MIEYGHLEQELGRRRGRDQDRLADYDRYLEAYFGPDDDQYRSAVRPMDGTARPIARLQQTREDLRNRGGAPNLLQPIVDDFVSLSGVLPTLKVMPAKADDAAKEESAKRSRILRTQYTQSNMDLQQFEAAFHLTCLGDTVYTLTPLFPDEGSGLRQPGIYLTVQDPRFCFPRFRTGWDRWELDDLIVVEDMDAERAEADFAIEPDRDWVEVVHYLGLRETATFVDGHRVAGGPHDLGFCPAQWVLNKTAARRHAQSDIAHVIEQHQEMQVMSLVMADSLIEATYAQTVIENPVAFEEQFEIGPGAKPIVVNTGGKAYRLQPGAIPQNAALILDKTWQNIQHMTGSSPIRTEGSIDHANTSARAVHAVQGPMETRLAAKQTILGQAMQKLNSKILRMLTVLPEFKNAEMTVYGEEKGAMTADTFTGAELEGWTQTRVEWPAMIGSTVHERVVVGLQMHAAGAVPLTWVVEQAGLDDPEMLIAEAKSEKAAMMAEQAAQGQGQPPGGPGGPPPGGGPPDPGAAQAAATSKGDQAAGMMAGGPPPPAQPPPGGMGGGGAALPPPPGGSMPGFPPQDSAPTTPGAGSPDQLPDVQAQIDEALRQIGPSLSGGVVSVTPIPGGIRIVITDRADMAKIKGAFKQFGKVDVQVGH